MTHVSITLVTGIGNGAPETLNHITIFDGDLLEYGMLDFVMNPRQLDNFVLFSTNVSNICGIQKHYLWTVFHSCLCASNPMRYFECSISLTYYFDWISDLDVKLQFRFLEL